MLAAYCAGDGCLVFEAEELWGVVRRLAASDPAALIAAAVYAVNALDSEPVRVRERILATLGVRYATLPARLAESLEHVDPAELVVEAARSVLRHARLEDVERGVERAASATG